MKALAEALLTEPLGPIRGCIRSVIGVEVGVNTVTRWTRQGVRVGDKSVVLESVSVGGRLFTSIGAVRRFVAAQQVVPNACQLVGAAEAVRSPASRNLAAVAAGLELKAMGC